MRKIGDLDAALAQARSDAKNESLPDQKQADAGASAECLDTFIKNLNILNIAGKDIVGLPDEQFPVTLGLLRIQIDFACLLKSTSKKDKIEKVGAIFLNTQKGKGLGQKDDAKAKRNKAGETVALLVFKRLMDEFSDIGEPMQEDAIHLYVRAGHLWSAPIAYANRLKNLEAESRILASLWDSVNPPPDFNPDKAKYHD